MAASIKSPPDRRLFHQGRHPPLEEGDGPGAAVRHSLTGRLRCQRTAACEPATGPGGAGKSVKTVRVDECTHAGTQRGVYHLFTGLTGGGK